MKMKSVLSILGMFLVFFMMFSLVSANSIGSSTMVFEGSLTDNGDGTYSGILNAVHSFDVYAEEGGCALVDGYYGNNSFNCNGIDTFLIGSDSFDDHDAYPNSGGPWGQWYNPDVSDYQYYDLVLNENSWRVRYNQNDDLTPLFGSMDWTNFYATEENQKWDENWSWGNEEIPLEFKGFEVKVESNGNDYIVTLTPAKFVCDDDSDCDDGNACTEDVCVLNVCQHTFTDEDGPVTSGLVVSPEYNNGNFNISAVAEDQCSAVDHAEYYVGQGSPACVGNSYPMNAADSSFDDLIENLTKYHYNSPVIVQDGQNYLCIKSYDSLGNPGNCACTIFESDELPPERIVNITLNNVTNPHELLICGDDPLLEATVCDSESWIQGGEFFLNLMVPNNPIPLPWTGYWMNVDDDQYYNSGWHCADLQRNIPLNGTEAGTVDLGLNHFELAHPVLAEGTHYINQIRGKDSVENWGKVWNQNLGYSFIKDTTAPKTLKTLTAFEDEKVNCNLTEVNNHDLTNGCYYVKQGTTIKLDARDFNPDDMTDDIGLGDGYNNLPGEYAGDVTIHYRVWWRNDTADDWTLSQTGDLNDETATITLSEDSYHLIEYWSTDGTCNNEETHHFELDIVDTAAPISESTIIGPFYNDTAEGKFYVDTATRVNLTCEDVQPHPVGGENIYYNLHKDGEAGSFVPYNGEFGFPEEAKYSLEYYCEDALKNTEVTHTEVYYSDHTKPTTNLAYGTPFNNQSIGDTNFPKYITSDTNLTLTANDDSGTINSGVNHTKYRITKVPDRYCMSPSSGCSTYNDNHVMYNDWVTETSSPFSFNINETSCHLIEYYSVDNVEKTEVVNEDCVFVDNEAPETTYNITGPEYFEQETNKTYIDNASRVVLTCQDYYDEDNGYYTKDHAVGADKIFYNYSVNGVANQTLVEYTQGSEGIYFPYEGFTEIGYYCEDLLGNTEDANELDVYVDHTKPNTNISFDTPYYTNNVSEWITQMTDIELNATDGEEADDSGVANTYYRWLKVDDDYCYGNASGDYIIGSSDNYVSGTGLGPFTINEDSCHEIEYWSVDNVNKTEAKNRKYVFVDTHAPDSEKTLDYSYEVMPDGEPSYAVMGENGIFVWKDSSNVWHVRWTTDWNNEHTWKNVVGTIYTGDDGVFSNFNEYSFDDNGANPDDTSTHADKMITFNAWVDGGEDGIDFKYSGDYLTFNLTYNGVENKSMVFVGENKTNPVSMPFTLPFTYITQDTNITLTCEDRNDHPVGADELNYRIWYKKLANDSWAKGDWANYTEAFNFERDSYHMLEYYCVDKLGNEEEHRFEVDYVDSQAPNTTKTVGEPKVACGEDEDCHYWVTNETEIDLSCEDLGEHPSGEDYIEYRWFKDGILSQNWTNYVEPFVFNDGDSNHTLEYKCVDKLGNWEATKVEYDRVDTEGPTVERKFARVNGGEIIEGGSVGNDTVIAITSNDTIKLCANVEDYKANGDAGVGIKKVKYSFVGLPDPRMFWDEDEQAYCIEKTGDEIGMRNGRWDCGKWRFEVKGIDLLGNKGNWTNGIEVLVDNVAPVGEVLNPHAGNYYRDGVPFQVYAPAVDFGGDECSLSGYGMPGNNCPASGVDYCDMYAIDYDFEGMNQSEIKECYSDLWTYFMQIGESPNVVYLGRVPYEDGVCKGTVSLPEDSGLTDTVFLGINYVDKAGNKGVTIGPYNLQLALNPWFSPITMNIDNEGPMVYVEDSNLPGPLTSAGDGDNIYIKATVDDGGASGFDACRADIYTNVNGEVGDYVGQVLGAGVDFDTCRIDGALPDGLKSGNYLVKVVARDKEFNVGTQVLPLIVDNTRPNMSVVAPMKGEVYGEMFPVSLDVEDSQSNIADETVKFMISEIPTIGNLYCFLGNCENTGWVSLDEQDNGLYATTINLTEYNISGHGRYVFDAVACDNLYVEDDGTELGFSMGNSRTDAHCRMISKHGQVVEEERAACNDGIDNDGDGYIDLGDNGCDNSSDDSEVYVEPVCDDTDGDGVCDILDNCVAVANPDQIDSDADEIGDACDNCINDSNPGQEDSNLNGVGDVCEVGNVCDVDGDGYNGSQCGGTDCNDNNSDSWRAGLFYYDGDQDGYFGSGANRREDGMMAVCYGTIENIFEHGYTNTTLGYDCDDGDSSITDCVKINEFAANRPGSEPIELYNPNNFSADLTDWELEDGASWSHLLSGNITPDGFLVINTGSEVLNNPGDIIKLKDNYGVLVDSVSFGDWDDGNIADNAPVDSDGGSVGRSPDGYDTNVDSVDFNIFASPTFGSPNAVL